VRFVAVLIALVTPGAIAACGSASSESVIDATVDAHDDAVLDAASDADAAPVCASTTAPESCGRGNPVVDATTFTLPDGGTSPPMDGKICSEGRTVVACFEGDQGHLSDAAAATGCHDVCCPNEYGVTCPPGPTNPDFIAGCRNVNGPGSGGGGIYCCPCL
jgi:hypothetical protein